MKSIMKEKNTKFNKPKVNFETQDNSIRAVNMTLPEEDLQVHSSVPGPFKNSSATRPNGLRGQSCLWEFVQFIHQWRDQVEQVCKCGGDAGEGSNGGRKMDSPFRRSLEECRQLILQWAEELRRVDRLFQQCPRTQEDWEGDHCASRETEKDPQALLEQRIIEWATELLDVSESYGLPREELTQMLRHLEVKKKRLVSLLPFLEFITWSMLKEDNKGTVPQLWLSAKQHTWKAETPSYIPNSVWSWICSASAEVTLDPMTNHPWLLLSDDRLKVQEALAETDVTGGPQRFDSWPCVLGSEGLSAGRHYWEVELANNGYWRVGLTTGSSRRRGRFTMSPAEGYWTLWRSTRQFYACTSPETPLPLGLVPRKVGVYLDYEEGQISFYNVDTKSHIFTFSATFHEELYPLFAPLDGRTLITISSLDSRL